MTVTSIFSVKADKTKQNKQKHWWYFNPRTDKKGGVVCVCVCSGRGEGLGVDATPHQVFLQFDKIIFQRVPAVFSSCAHIS